MMEGSRAHEYFRDTERPSCSDGQARAGTSGCRLTYDQKVRTYNTVDQWLPVIPTDDAELTDILVDMVPGLSKDVYLVLSKEDGLSRTLASKAVDGANRAVKRLSTEPAKASIELVRYAGGFAIYVSRMSDTAAPGDQGAISSGRASPQGVPRVR